MLSIGSENREISTPENLIQVGLVANEIAAQSVFGDYRSCEAVKDRAVPILAGQSIP